jgi:hypothetical protein
MILVYSDGVSDLAELFSDAVDIAGGSGLSAPTPGSVADMTLNGSPARWAEYASDIAAGKKTVQLHAFLGAVLSPEHEAGISFVAIMPPRDYAKIGESLRASWASLRLHGKPLTGVGEVVDVDARSVRIEKKVPEASTFEHNLVTVSLPAGWTAELSNVKNIVAKVKHDSYGSITIMGGLKNELGKSRDEIINGVRDGLMQGIPAMKPARGAWTVPTQGCGEAVIEQYEGVLVAEGMEIPYGAILGATKDGQRGLGFMALFKSDVKEQAAAEALQIIGSAK